MTLLHTYVYDPDKSKYNDCSICLKEFEQTPMEPLMQIPNCEHVFHEQCLRSWFLEAQICPMCRGTIIRVPHNYTEERPESDHPPQDG